MAQTIRCPAGQRTRIIASFATGMPKTFEVTIEGPATGEFEEKRYWWIFGQTPRRGPLAPRMKFERRWINAIYRVWITPDHDVVATVD